jgi:bifunctional ADP-heptose synthase (sugar kinase/adenylyltransferase)
MTPFEAVIDQFSRKRLLVVGDIMLERFVYGTVSRISPEAPLRSSIRRLPMRSLGAPAMWLATSPRWEAAVTSSR